ncbi:hypothetical protein ACXR8F_13130 [Terrabacter sp. AAH1]
MATKRSTSSSARTKRSTARRTTRRTSTSSTRRRTTSGSLYPRRRASGPGLPTTVGTAIGTLVVTTLLDLSWPMRLLLIGVVLVLGLGYVLWRHRAEIAASSEPTPPEPAGPPAGPEVPPTSS